MLTICPVDHVYVRVDCDDAIAHELSEYFQFDVPGARYMQSKFGKNWSGKIKLFKLRDHHIYAGLVPRLIEFAAQQGYPCFNTLSANRPYLSEDLEKALKTIPSLPFAPRDYQFAALLQALNDRRCIILSPTGSGKSFIIYLLTRLLKLKTLVVVPTIGLVTQMAKDFSSYGQTKVTQTIQGGSSKEVIEQLTVSTWQSIYDLPSEWYAQFGCIIVDEVHTAKSKSITGLMEKCTTIPYRFGFTGTIDNTECHRLVLEGLFGAVTRVATTDDLVKQKQLAPLRIKVAILDYPEPVRKALKRQDYPTEMDYLAREPARNEFIARLVNETKGNTLVLFQYVDKHGIPLFKRIQELSHASGKVVHYISGAIDGAERERIRQAVETGDNHVIAASYGTMQLGINIPNLRNLVFAHAAKSPIRVLQSIGRVLRLSEGKDMATLIDIADDLRHGKYINHVWRHAEDRMNYYSTEKFPVTEHRIDLASIARFFQQPSEGLLAPVPATTAA